MAKKTKKVEVEPQIETMEETVTEFFEEPVVEEPKARERKKSPVDGSYTNKLLSDKSLSKEKVLEEINELIEAVENNSNKIHEAADVFYHLIMYLEANDIKIEDVMNELNKRKK